MFVKGEYGSKGAVVALETCADENKCELVVVMGEDILEFEVKRRGEI